MKERLDIVGDVRGGHGLMTGIELVSDASAKTPIDGETMKRIHMAAYAAGAIVRIGGNNILMSPPLVITEDEINRVLTGLESGLRAA